LLVLNDDHVQIMQREPTSNESCREDGVIFFPDGGKAEWFIGSVDG